MPAKTETAPDRSRAVRLETTTGDLRLVERELPEPGRGQVRLRIAFAGVCHSDLHFIDGEQAARMPDRVTLGHEISGLVDAVGPGVTHHAPGDRVIVHAVDFNEGETWVLGVHFDGSWADHLVVPEHLLVDIGPDVPLDQAAVIPDAVAAPWAAISSTARVRAGESAAVWGLGGLGYHAIQLLRIVGAGPVIGLDPNPAARERALRAGADAVLDPLRPDLPTALADAVGPRGLDVAFDFAGLASIHQQAFDAVRRTGRVVLIGIPAKPFHLASTSDLIRLQKQVLGHYGSERHHLEELVELVRLGRLDLRESISEVLPLDEFATAVEHLRTQHGDPIRILLQP